MKSYGHFQESCHMYIMVIRLILLTCIKKISGIWLPGKKLAGCGFGMTKIEDLFNKA